MKAIETRYRGRRFRSRLEARWAVFFDAMGIRWEYEPEGFDLGPPHGRYLPDFFLAGLSGGVYAEVKPLVDDFMKARRFAGLSKQRVLCLSGEPDFVTYDLVEADPWGSVISMDCIFDSRYIVEGYSHHASEYRLYMGLHGRTGYRIEENADPLLIAAVHAARAARFEFADAPSAI